MRIKKTVTRVGKLLLAGLWAVSFVFADVLPASAVTGVTDTLNYPVEASASESTAPADGSTPIRIDLYMYGYQCPGEMAPRDSATCADGSTSTQKVPVGDRWIGVYTVVGTGNIYTGLSTPLGVQYVTSGVDGKASFTIASSIAEVKTLKFSDHVLGVPPPWSAVVTLTFTVPPAKVTKPTSVASGVTVVQAGTPQLKSVEVDDKKLSQSAPVTLTSKQTLRLTGVAAPDGTVTLDVNAKESKTATVHADADGNWTYEFVKPTAGPYIVSATATDPTGGQPSLKVTLVSFTVTDPAKPVVASQIEKQIKPKSTNAWKWIVPSVVVGVIVLAYVWRLLRHRHYVKKSPGWHDYHDEHEETAQQPTPKPKKSL